MTSVALGATALIMAVRVSFRYFIPFPFEDQWAIIQEFVTDPGRISLHTAWALHNEHRLPFAKLLMMADLYWFKGQNISLYTEIYCVQVLHLTALVFAIRRGGNWPAWLLLTGSGIVTFALFWVSQYQSFLNPFGISILPAYAFASCAVIALLFVGLETKQAFRRQATWLFISVVAAFVSEASQANGLLVWPLILLLALRMRLSPFCLTVIATAGMFFCGVYLIGYHGPIQHANPFDSLQRPALLLAYIRTYFGFPWVDSNFVSGSMITTLGIIMAVVCYLWELFAGTVRAFSLSLVTIAVFLLGTGFITSLGRINFPVEQATSSRYQSSALLFWACCALYLLDVAYRHGSLTVILVAAATIGLLLEVLPSLGRSLQGAREMTDRLRSGALPVYSDVKDETEISKLMVPATTVFNFRTFLRSHSTTFYADHRYQLLGKRLTATLSVAPASRCIGASDRDRRISDSSFPGWELFGWGWDLKAMRPVKETVAVGESGIITGLGTTGLYRPDVPAAIHEVSNADVGWRTYVQGQAPPAHVQIYGILDNGKSACLIPHSYVGIPPNR